MESRGLIEFRFPDGSVVTGEYDDYAKKYLNRGDELEFQEIDWVMYDREDRRGVTVFVCRPVVAASKPA